MKGFFLTMTPLAATSLAAQNRLTVKIDGQLERKGHLIIGVYDSVNFLQKPVFTKMQKIENDTVAVVFDNIPSNEYAISLFQDMNENQRLDFGEYGIPSEPYGYSNNVLLNGKPTFKDCRFAVGGDTTIYITLKKFDFDSLKQRE